MHVNAAALGDAIDQPAVGAAIAALHGMPEWERRPVWLHGDLHSANILVDDGAIGAVIDFGDITSGDPAVDLAVAWMLFDTDARAEFRAASSADGDTWRRGRAWALHFALVYLAHSADNPRFQRMGRALLATVLNVSGSD